MIYTVHYMCDEHKMITQVVIIIILLEVGKPLRNDIIWTVGLLHLRTIAIKSVNIIRIQLKEDSSARLSREIVDT